MFKAIYQACYQRADYIALLFFVCVSVSSAAQLSSDWKDHVGSHYSEHAWATAVRDFQGPGSAGLAYPSQNKRSAKISARALGGDVDTLIFNIGGLGSGRDVAQVDDFMRAVQARNGTDWSANVRDRVVEVANEFKTSSVKIYWQFGNEINSEQFSRALHQWARDGKQPRGHDQETIAWYVEYYLAPGIEGILEARRDNPELSGKLNIVLGSIGVARNPRAVEWLDTLIGYKINGKYAQSLRGKRVADLVDVISLHYLVGTPGDGWRAILDDLYNKWFRKSAIKAIWSTEEIGIRRAREGYAASTAVVVLARYMDWWSEKKMNATEGKVYFWGTGVGSGQNQADFMLNEIVRNFSAESLVPLYGRLEVRGDGQIENYHYRSSVDQNKQIIMAFPHERTSVRLSQIEVLADHMPRQINAEMFILNPKSNVRYKLKIEKIKNKYLLKMNSAVELPEGTAVIFILSP